VFPALTSIYMGFISSIAWGRARDARVWTLTAAALGRGASADRVAARPLRGHPRRPSVRARRGFRSSGLNPSSWRTTQAERLRAAAFAHAVEFRPRGRSRRGAALGSGAGDDTP
jgi:hypothetical protein